MIGYLVVDKRIPLEHIRVGDTIYPETLRKDSDSETPTKIPVYRVLLEALKEQKVPSNYLQVDTQPDLYDLHSGLNGTGSTSISSAVVVKKYSKESLNNFMQIKLSEINNPVNPLLVQPDKDLDWEPLLRRWIQIKTWYLHTCDATLAMEVPLVIDRRFNVCVADSVLNLVKNATWHPHWEAVPRHTYLSLVDATWAYIATLFPSIRSWRGNTICKGLEQPWDALETLWRSGYVPSRGHYDEWHLHSGRLAEVVHTISYP